MSLVKILPVGVLGRKGVYKYGFCYRFVICATVIVVTYMLCRVREREQDLEDVYEDISLLRVSVDRFNSIEEVNASNLSCLSDHLKHVDEEIDEIQNELCNRLELATCTLPFTVGGTRLALWPGTAPTSEAGRVLGREGPAVPGSCRQGRCLGLVLPLGNF